MRQTPSSRTSPTTSRGRASESGAVEAGVGKRLITTSFFDMKRLLFIIRFYRHAHILTCLLRGRIELPLQSTRRRDCGEGSPRSAYPGPAARSRSSRGVRLQRTGQEVIVCVSCRSKVETARRGECGSSRTYAQIYVSPDVLLFLQHVLGDALRLARHLRGPRNRAVLVLQGHSCAACGPLQFDAYVERQAEVLLALLAEVNDTVESARERDEWVLWCEWSTPLVATLCEMARDY